MDKSCLWIDQFRKGLDVRGLKLGKLAVFKHSLNEWMFISQRFQNTDIWGESVFCFSNRGELQFLEQDVAQLLRRVDVKLFSRKPINLLRELAERSLKFLGHSVQKLHIDCDPGLFHPRQDRNERNLNIRGEGGHALLLNRSAEYRDKPKRNIGVFA